MNLTKAHIKLIHSLAKKKNRDELGLFIAEGVKIIQDLIDSGLIPHLIFQTYQSVYDTRLKINTDSIKISDIEMAKISNLNTPTEILAIFEQKRNVKSDFSDIKFSPILFLDEIQDPGNMGTIIRTADWFGIKQIVCSPETVDCYNPKVVQATMGSIARVDIKYIEPSIFFNQLTKDYEIIGAYMVGESIHNVNFQKKSVIVIGNEGKGISHITQKFISKKISIPKHLCQTEQNSIESLNASIACSIICYEFSKQLL